jgi:hypothetical protein
VAGKLNNAVMLDGSADFIQVTGNASLRPATTVTVAAHVKTASAPSEAEVVSMGDNYTLRIKADGNVRFSYHIGNLVYTALETTGVNVLDNTFHHLVGQKTSSGVQIYVDGVLKTSLTVSNSIVYTLGPNLMIGRHGNGGTRYFNGVIDEVKIYNQTLSASEISTLASILRTDRNVQQITNVAPPAQKNQTITEPNFNVQILRVTDNNDGSECHTGYSYWPSLNSNNTWILFACGATVYKQGFDPMTRTLVGIKSPVVTNPTDTDLTDDVLWTPIYPDVLIYHKGKVLYWKNVGTGASGTEKDFTSWLGTNQTIWQLSASADNDRYAFAKKNGTNNYEGWIVYSRSNPSVPIANDTYTPPGDGTKLDEVRIDKTGRYLSIILNLDAVANKTNKPRVKIKDLTTGTTTDLLWNDPPRPPGHYDVGTGKLVGTDDWQNGVLFRNLNNPQSFTSIINYGATPINNWGRGVHVSMLADNEGWVLNSTFNTSGLDVKGLGDAQNPPKDLDLQNEIFQIATDGSQKVRRITHHHSRTMDSGAGYFNSPRANISRDGRFVVWTSYWNALRRDVYLAIIPSAP